MSALRAICSLILTTGGKHEEGDRLRFKNSRSCCSTSPVTRSREQPRVRPELGCSGNQLKLPVHIYLCFDRRDELLNSAAHQCHPWKCATRRIRARKIRFAPATSSTPGKPMGISKATRGCGCLRVAKYAPPALIFTIVLNSSISLRALSQPRTNTGIASGKRGHSRRSFSRVCKEKGQWRRVYCGACRPFYHALPRLSSRKFQVSGLIVPTTARPSPLQRLQLRISRVKR